MNTQPIHHYYKAFKKQLSSIDSFNLLTMVLFCLLPISHKSIEIIRYIFIALSLTLQRSGWRGLRYRWQQRELRF